MSHLCPLVEIDKTTFTADELFYKGKLLPLHLPPPKKKKNTPFESCTVSPADSCQVSKEPNPKDYFLEYSSSVEEDEKKKSWSKKLRLNTRLTYLRSFFGKSSCSDEPRVADEGSILRYSRAERPKKKSNGSVPGRRAIAHRRSFSISMRRQPAKSSNKKSSTSLGNLSNGSRSSRGLMRSDSVRCQHQELQWQMIENGFRCLEVK
ncbi:hypothetical protein IGI04_039312 [Brassica rapa subsp. trilocularis]|uniref:Uncharacterized protein n=1 Tax=Brassica rapa subsp. trilocularis TaxID=1813537 RepID=A0ABQ7KL60_BRACM|nr:hypothetical protein IGI04_039312 [Brassica rapa subsp. trilocularis]